MFMRTMRRSDIPAGLRLCRASGWNQLEDDWSVFLDSNQAGCRVAEKDGRVIGTVATLPYQERFSWLSMLLVDPKQRRGGVGTALLLEGLRLLSETCVRLDATAAGRELYLQHGFHDEYPISRLALKAEARPSTPAEDVKKMSEQDFARVLAEDCGIFGASRERVLRSLYERAPEFAYVVEKDGIEGYCFARPGFLYQQLGPIVAKHESVARTLISECISHSGKQHLGIDVPEHSPSWLDWLKLQGFEEERSFVRMYKGEHRYPGVPESVYATVGPEFG
jgi:N-acetylglutamate synthase-like GNAT family acetyltransferase